MAKRVPLQTIIVYRDGKQCVPRIGDPFDFTKEEIEQIKSVAPDALRNPVNEDVIPATPQEAKDQKEAKAQKSVADQRAEANAAAQTASQRARKASHQSRSEDRGPEEGDL